MFWASYVILIASLICPFAGFYTSYSNPEDALPGYWSLTLLAPAGIYMFLLLIPMPHIALFAINFFVSIWFLIHPFIKNKKRRTYLNSATYGIVCSLAFLLFTSFQGYPSFIPEIIPKLYFGAYMWMAAIFFLGLHDAAILKSIKKTVDA